MTDDRKYSSLYSAIQGVGRRPKPSPTSREGSPARTQSSPPRTSRKTLPAGLRVGSVLKIPHVLENEDNSLAPPESSRVRSVLKIPQFIDNQDAVPAPPLRTSSRQAPASSFFALNPNRSSTAPFDDAARLSTTRSSPSTPFTDLSRRSQAEMGSFQVAETDQEYDQNQEVSLRASRVSSRFSIPPAGTNRGSRTSGRQSQFISPSKAVEPQEISPSASTQNTQFSVSPSVGNTRRSKAIDGQGRRAAKLIAPDDSTNLQEGHLHASTQQARFSVPPLVDNTRSSNASAPQFTIPNNSEERQELHPRASMEQTRLSIPLAVDNSRSSRADGTYEVQGRRPSPFMIPGDAEEPQEAQTRSSTQQARSSVPTSVQETRFSIPRAEGQVGGRGFQSLTPGDLEEPQEGLPRTSSAQEARFSIPVLDASTGLKTSRLYDGGRKSQFTIPGDAEETQEVLPHAYAQQARYSVLPPRDANQSSRTSGVYDGQAGRKSQFMTYNAVEDPQEAFSRASTQQTRFSSLPLLDGVRGSQTGRTSGVYYDEGLRESQLGEDKKSQDALVRASAQQARFSIPPLIDANRSSGINGVYNGTESDSKGKASGEALSHASAEQTRFSISPRLDANKSFRASEFYNGHGGRDSQYMTADTMDPSRMSSSMPALRSPREGSSLAALGAESPRSPPKVTFSIPTFDAQRSLRIPMNTPEGTQEPFIVQGDSIAFPRLSSQAARSSSPTVDKTESFLRVPSALEPEDEADPNDTQAMEITSTNLSPRTSAWRSRMPSSSLSQIPRISDDFEQNRRLQMMDGGIIPSNRASSISSPGSQVEAEWSPRSGSLLRIPSVMDNEPEVSPHASMNTSFANASRDSMNTSFVNASGDSRADSSFVNPEMFGSEIYRDQLLPANMPHSLDEVGHNMQQGDQHFVSPRSTGLLLADVDRQASRASWKSSPGSEQNSRTASPSHRFSQVSRPASVLSSIGGGEDVVTQGSRLSSMPLDSIQTSLPESFQNEPKVESMSLSGAGTQHLPVYFDTNVDYVENSFGLFGEGSFLPDVSRDTMTAGDEPHIYFKDLEKSRNGDALGETRIRGSAGPSHISEQFLEQAPWFSSAAPFDSSRSSSAKSYIGKGIRESQVLKGEDSLPPRSSNQLPRPSSFMSRIPSNRSSEMSSIVLPQGFERNSSVLGSARSSQAEALPVHQQHMPSYSMVTQDAEPQMVALTQQAEDAAADGEGQVIGYNGMASPRILRQPSRFSSVDASGSSENQDPYNQVEHDYDSITAETGIPPLSSTEIPRDFSDADASPGKGPPFVQAGETEGPAFSNHDLSPLLSRGSQSSSPLTWISNTTDAGRPSLTLDPNSTAASPMPNQHLQRSSSLSFSKQIQKRGSLGMPLTPRESGENMFNETGNTTSDNSSEDFGQDKRLSLESVSRPSFSAKLSEQQSMIRPWDTERLTDTEKRMSHALDGLPSYSIEDPNYTTITRPENADASSAFFRASTENMPRTIEGGLNQWPSQFLNGTQPFDLSESNDQQGEERTRASLLPTFDRQESPNFHSVQDPEKFSTKSSRKSLVQEFIYPTSPPRNSFRESISPRTDQRQSLHQEASYQSTSPRLSVRQSSPRLSVRQSLSHSKKDLTELQTQEFMYSPSLARTTLDRGLDQEQDQAMPQSMDTEMDDTEFPSQDLTYSPQSARQSFEQILPEENAYDEVQYEDPTYPRDSYQQNIEEEDVQGKTHPSLQRDFYQQNIEEEDDQEETHPSLQEQAMNDEECYDDDLATTEHDDSKDLVFEEKEDMIEDPCSTAPKDDLHSESFTNLEDSLGSFKRAFGGSTSFIKVPFGASELSYEAFAKVQYMEPTAGIWPIVWKSVAMQDLIRFTKAS